MSETQNAETVVTTPATTTLEQTPVNDDMQFIANVEISDGSEPEFDLAKESADSDAMLASITQKVNDSKNVSKPTEPKPDANQAKTDGTPEPAKDGSSESPADKKFAEMRIENKALKERLESLESKLNPNSTPKPEIDPDQIFNAYVMARDGKLFPGNDYRNQEAFKTAKDVIEAMSMDEVVGVYKKAQNNQFGDISADVLEIAKDAMPIIQINERSEQKAQQTEQSNKAQFDQQVKGQIERAGKDFPDLMKADSALTKHGNEFDLKFIGKIENGKIVEKGTLDDRQVSFLAANPYFHAQIVKLSFDASRTEKAETELKGLKEKFNLTSSLETPSVSVSRSSKRLDDMGMEDLDRELSRRMSLASR